MNADTSTRFLFKGFFIHKNRIIRAKITIKRAIENTFPPSHRFILSIAIYHKNIANSNFQRSLVILKSNCILCTKHEAYAFIEFSEPHRLRIPTVIGPLGCGGKRPRLHFGKESGVLCYCCRLLISYEGAVFY